MYECRLCAQKNDNVTSFVQHMLIKHKSFEFPCNICYINVNFTDLKAHKISHLNMVIKSNIFVCKCKYEGIGSEFITHLVEKHGHKLKSLTRHAIEKYSVNYDPLLTAALMKIKYNFI